MSPLEIRSTYSAATFNGPITASSVSLTPSDDLAEVALVLGGVGPGGQLAFDGGLGRACAASADQAVEGVDALVEVVLDLVEVAVVGVGDLRRDVALGDPVDVLGRHHQAGR